MTVCHVLKSLGADPVVVISRTGENNYENLDRHLDAKLLINATPLGMYPNNGESPVDLTRFSALDGVLDVVYNPARTALMLQAEQFGIPHASRLSMLVAQAKKACEYFTGNLVPDAEIDRIERLLSRQMENIILIGMPGCGKSAVAGALGKALGREVFDTDAYIEEHTGYTPEQIITMQGESVFRTHESEAVRELGSAFGAIVATGGGAVLHEENYAPLHQNGVIFWLRRDLDKLERDGRPLSRAGNLNAMYEMREKRYLRFADYIIDNNRALEDTVEDIRKVIL
mgnify:CR=1 FL=1